MGSLYKLTCRVTGKSYIGITSGRPRERWKTHVYLAANGGKSAISCAIRKYGPDQFTVEQLADMADRSALSSMEVAAIAEHRTRAPDGYNLTDGGDNDFTFTEEVRQKMKAAATKRWSDPALRAKQSKELETRRLISLSTKASWRDEECRSRRINKINTPVALAKMSAGARKKWSDESQRAQHKKNMSRIWDESPERRANLSAENTRRNYKNWKDPAYRADIRSKFSEAAKRRWSDPAKRAALMEARRKSATKRG